MKNLHAVAVLFVVVGLFAWIDAASLLAATGRIRLSIGLLALPAGLGLMRGRESWLAVSRVLVVFAALSAVAVPVLALTLAPGLEGDVFGRPMALASASGMAIVAVQALAYLAILFWIYRVLDAARTDFEAT